jgi:hypothetical protein
MIFPPLAFGAITGVVPRAARPYSEKVLPAIYCGVPPARDVAEVLNVILLIAALFDHKPAINCE